VGQGLQRRDHSRRKLPAPGKKAVKVVGKVAGNRSCSRGVAIAAIVAWVLGGAKWTIDHMASVISHSTSPTLTASWFTAAICGWRAGLVLHAAVHLRPAAEALLRSDGALLARAVSATCRLAALQRGWRRR